jgi:hypothetical protein
LITSTSTRLRSSVLAIAIVVSVGCGYSNPVYHRPIGLFEKTETELSTTGQFVNGGAYGFSITSESSVALHRFCALPIDAEISAASTNDTLTFQIRCVGRTYEIDGQPQELLELESNNNHLSGFDDIRDPTISPFANERFLTVKISLAMMESDFPGVGIELIESGSCPIPHLKWLLMGKPDIVEDVSVCDWYHDPAYTIIR